MKKRRSAERDTRETNKDGGLPGAPDVRPFEGARGAAGAFAAEGASGGAGPATAAVDALAWDRSLRILTDRIDRLAVDLEKSELKEYVNLMRRPWSLIWRNFVAGLTRGIGIALGFTFFAATIVWLLQLLGALNLPIVGDYIADLVRIVQRQLEINPY